MFFFSVVATIKQLPDDGADYAPSLQEAAINVQVLQNKEPRQLRGSWTEQQGKLQKKKLVHFP